MKNEDYLGVRDTAIRLGYTLKHVYDMCYTGRIKAKKECGRWRIPVEEINSRLQKRGE